MHSKPQKKSFLGMLDTFRSIAQTGLNYTDDNFDKERYKHMLELSIRKHPYLNNYEIISLGF
ncbi:MAG: NUDIX hydrolase N-terminal domain-containing protein [Bacteroidota bacterium]